MELVGYELGMVVYFDYFYQFIVVGVVDNFQVGGFQFVQVVVVDFVVVVVMFDDVCFVVVFCCYVVVYQYVFLVVQVYGIIQV